MPGEPRSPALINLDDWRGEGEPGGMGIRPSRTLFWNFSVATVSSWVADKDYWITSGTAWSCAFIVSRVNDTFVNLNTSGFHDNYLVYVSNAVLTVYLNQPVLLNERIYVASSSAGQIFLALAYDDPAG